MDHERLDALLQSYPGCTKDFKAEWQWWRYQVGGKMFAATLHPGPEHAPEYAGRNLLTLKCDPVWSEQLRAEQFNAEQKEAAKNVGNEDLPRQH